MLTVKCDNCGKSLKRYKDKVKRNKRNYCNVQCRAQGQRKYQKGTKHHNYNSIIVECAHCKKPVTRCKSYVNTYENLFCNDKCRGKWMSENLVGENHPNYSKVKVICDYCGNEFARQPNQTKNKKRQFCDRKCFNKWKKESGFYIGENNPAWKGGKRESAIRYGPGWLKQRHLARKRDEYTCQECGITEKEYGQELDVHHIIPFRRFGLKNHRKANRLTNLISLCRTCHRKEE